VLECWSAAGLPILPNLLVTENLVETPITTAGKSPGMGRNLHNNLKNGRKNMMAWMPVRIFWLIPIIWMIMFFVRALRSKQYGSGCVWMRAFPQSKPSPHPKETSQHAIPEALKQAGQQVLENLDWEIRLLERQQTIVSDSKERQALKQELQQKRVEYQATIDRLQL
jgi:hypothetical protein